MAGSIGSKIVQGAQWARSNTGQAIIGGVAAAAGAAMIGQAYLRPPQASSQSKYLGDLMFPGDLIDPSANRNSYISIKFQKYERRSIFSQPFLRFDGGIRLPLPNELREQQGVTYEPAPASNPAVGAGIEQGLRSGQGTGGAFGGIAAGAINAANRTLQNATTGVASALTGASAGEMLQLGGLAQNPFLTVLFKQPEFKKHSFSWKLAPNNAQESNTVKDIINSFKSNMLPAMAPNAGGTLLTYPNMAIINLYPDENFLYKFKPCVIESMNVNYAVGGQPSFFKGTNAPTLVQIDINLLEIEYWLKEDIEDNSFRSGGALFG
jgi:hypothetical protein